MAIGLVGIRVGHTPDAGGGGGSGGGSYDNLNTWPSAANRPVYNAGTNTLTWYGPTDGGASTSSDVQQSQVLTAQTSLLTTSSDGQIIENLKVTVSGQVCVQVNHNNVTIRRCYIEGPGGSDKYNVAITPGVTGTLIEDCEIDGNGSSSDSGSFNILGHGGILSSCTVRRCHLHDAEQMVARTMQDVTIIDNYMHDTQGVDADMVEMYVDSGDSHDNLIQHNTFEQTGAGTGFNSAINMSNWISPNKIYNVMIENNRFLVPDFPHVFCDDNRQGSGTLNYAAINNGFINTIGSVSTGDNNGVSPNSGNFVLTGTSDTLITGAAFNGTGAV